MFEQLGQNKHLSNVVVLIVDMPVVELFVDMWVDVELFVDMLFVVEQFVDMQVVVGLIVDMLVVHGLKNIYKKKIKKSNFIQI